MVDKLHKGFSKLSLDLTKDIDKDIKKNSGIFFTPPATISTTLQYLKAVSYTHLTLPTKA